MRSKIIFSIYTLFKFSLKLIFHLFFLIYSYYIGKKNKKPKKPRILWGPYPLINIKYHSEAVKLFGYESKTFVYNVYHINKAEDFDYRFDDFFFSNIKNRILRLILKPIITYYIFAWTLSRFDIYNFYFTGGILSNTPLKYKELQFLHLAKKKVVVTAFGADVQYLDKMPNLLLKHAYLSDYPNMGSPDTNKITKKDIEYFCKHADYIIGGVDWVDYMPRWDKIISAHFVIDTEKWKPEPIEKKPNDPIKVFHAPNHPTIKGTKFLIEACDELKKEGYNIELIVTSKVPNDEIKKIMKEIDIVADQFIVGWYAMFALEGMSMGKPVLTYLREDLLQLYSYFSFAKECPIVNTPISDIKKNLITLIKNKELREELGKKGRAYVEKYHSYKAIGKMFDEIFSYLWEKDMH